MQAVQRGRLLVIAAAVCWSLAGAGVKLARPFDAWQIAGLRSLFAFLFLALALKAWRSKPLVPRLNVLLLALAYAGTVLLFIIANTMTTAANAIFLQDTAPIWVLIFAPIMLKEPFRLSDLAMLAICGFGMALFFFEDLTPGARNGNLIALVSGVGFGFVILGMRWGSRKKEQPDSAAEPQGPTEAEQLAIWGNLLCFALCIPWLSVPEASVATAIPWVVVLLLGLVQLGLSYLLLARGIKHVPAVEASLLVLVEPVLNPVWTFLASGEKPSGYALAGGTVIIGTVVFQALRGRN